MKTGVMDNREIRSHFYPEDENPLSTHQPVSLFLGLKVGENIDRHWYTDSRPDIRSFLQNTLYT